MAFHPTGVDDNDIALIHDGAFLHLRENGRELGLYGAITKDTQHAQKWDWDFAGELAGKTQNGHQDCTLHFRNGALSIDRQLDLADSKQVRERFTVTNHGDVPVEQAFTVTLGTNFNGIFQLREEAGQDDHIRQIQQQGNGFSYQRVDNGKTLSTDFTPVHDEAVSLQTQSQNGQLKHRFTVRLEPGQSAVFGHDATMEHGLAVSNTPMPTREQWRAEFGVPASEKLSPEWKPVAQAADDLHAMMMRSEQGIILAAGMPRFLNPFGRDQLLTALKIMPQDESQHWRGETVKGILRFLGANQGGEVRSYSPKDPEGNPHPMVDSFVVETPGEIPHEIRYDEQSGLGLIDKDHEMGKRPFGRFYGTADTTPLFVAVANEYYKATGDVAFMREILPNVEAALGWMESEHAITDEHGFLCYEAIPSYIPGGPLTNKIWKDSQESAVESDGSNFLEDANGNPRKANLAWIEVQGYAFRAYQGAAELYATLGDEAKAEYYQSKAATMRQNVQEHFLTTDRDGQPVYAMAVGYPEGSNRMHKLNVHSSNPAHALWTGVFGDEAKHVQPILDSLNSPVHLWSGWGYRTLGKNEPGYDVRPGYAYHNGPVWPHEPIVEGLQRYGQRDMVDRATHALYDLAQTMPGNSIPELLTGKERQKLKHTGQSVPPEPLGTASRIQTWSAAALLKAMEIRRQEKLPDLTEPKQHTARRAG